MKMGIFLDGVKAKQKGKLRGFKFRNKLIQKEVGPSENFFNQNEFSLYFIHAKINQNITPSTPIFSQWPKKSFNGKLTYD